MKIRNRITLWITGAGLLAGFLFSAVISYEMIEQPFELLDGELDSQAHTLLAGLAPRAGKQIRQPDKTMMESIGKLYWLKIFNHQQDLIYASSMTGVADLPLRKRNSGYNINAEIPIEAANLDQDDSGKVTFRVRVFTIPFAGQDYLIQIARPMDELEEEITDLVISISIGLILFTLTLIVLGYFVAGKILQPIADINRLARKISDKTLDQRIPLGKTQDELYTLSSSLNQMFDRLQFSFQRQKEFIANGSHELKTPIAIQRLFFDEAIQRDDLPDNFKTQLAGQARILFRMDRLVKNLLDLSALELKESYKPEIFDPAELATSVFREFNEIIQAADIHLSLNLEEKVCLQADKEKIRRMLINLIDNAIKYNFEQNGEIRFVLGTKKDKVCIEVFNSGQGIPADELNQVFNQFYRVEKSRATALGGSGLGLTIVKRIVELHHGSIEIESEFGNWVLVRVILPIQMY